LAAYFDTKLKEIMEELSQTVNVESAQKQRTKSEVGLSNSMRKEKSQWSVF
jgi:hypothetical protein